MGLNLEDINKKAPVRRTAAKKIDDYFKPASKTDQIKGLKIALQGGPKVGKTDFGMTMPPPIYIIDLELEAQLVYNNRYSAKSKPPYQSIFPDEVLDESGGKDVRILECVVLNNKDDIDYDKTIDYMFEALDAMAGINRGTVILDSATLYWKYEELKWKLIKPTKDGLKDKPGSKFKFQFDWGPPTEEYFRVMMRLMAKKGVHLVVCGHEDSLYDGSGNIIQGLYKGKWQKQTPHWMNMTLRLYKEYTTTESGLKPVYGARIVESRYARAIDTILPEVSYHGLKKVMKEQFEVEIMDYPGEK